MKDSAKKTKTLYIVLLICTVAAVIAAVTLSLVFGLGGQKSPEPIDNPGFNDDNGNLNNNNNDNDIIIPPGDDDDTQTGGEPIIVYQAPISNYVLGLPCDPTTFVKSSTLGWYTTHNGTDFLAEANAAVMSVYDGTVRDVGYSPLDGYYVIIDQADGIVATYKSLAQGILAEKGSTVHMGTVLGAAGNTMTSEQNEGIHLHLEMKLDGKFIDPMSKISPDDK